MLPKDLHAIVLCHECGKETDLRYADDKDMPYWDEVREEHIWVCPSCGKESTYDAREPGLTDEVPPSVKTWWFWLIVLPAGIAIKIWLDS